MMPTPRDEEKREVREENPARGADEIDQVVLHEEGEKKEDHSEYRPRNGNAREHRERLARELEEHDDGDGVEHYLFCSDGRLL